MGVQPENFTGWGIFSTKDGKTANLVREATAQERRLYLDLFPQISFMISYVGDIVYGCVVSNTPFKFSGPVPILLSDNVQLFDVVTGIFNGRHIWFGGLNRRYPRQTSIQLRTALDKNIKPADLNISGTSALEISTYSIVYQDKLDELMSNEEYRIKDQLRRAGGDYKGFRKQGQSFVVTYEVDGQEHTSRFNSNLRTQSAGICLVDHDTGIAHDDDFDLQSLVGVIREGQNTGRIYRQ